MPDWQSPHAHARPHGACMHLNLVYARAVKRDRQVRHAFRVELFQKFFCGLCFIAELRVDLIKELFLDGPLGRGEMPLTWWGRQRRPAASVQHVVALRTPIRAAPLASLSFRRV